MVPSGADWKCEAQKPCLDRPPSQVCCHLRRSSYTVYMPLPFPCPWVPVGQWSAFTSHAVADQYRGDQLQPAFNKLPCAFNPPLLQEGTA